MLLEQQSRRSKQPSSLLQTVANANVYFGTVFNYSSLATGAKGGGMGIMWLVISDENIIQFPQFDSAIIFAEEKYGDAVTVIDARKRTISIVKAEGVKLQETA